MRNMLFAGLLAISSFSAQSVAADTFVTFQSPSGNISCMIYEGSISTVRCDLRNFTPSYADPSCDLDFGFAFEVQARGSGYPVCAGDTVADPSAPVLRYGDSYTFGAFTCASDRRGLACQNLDGGGFFVSRARQQVF